MMWSGEREERRGNSQAEKMEKTSNEGKKTADSTAGVKEARISSVATSKLLVGDAGWMKDRRIEGQGNGGQEEGRTSQ